MEAETTRKKAYLSDVESYFQNFWKPKEGHKITKDGISEQEIREIDNEYLEQAIVRDDEKVVFLQDYSWKPSMEDLDDVLRGHGLEVGDDFILRRKQKLWMDKPTDLEGYKTVIMKARNFLRMDGFEPLQYYWGG